MPGMRRYTKPVLIGSKLEYLVKLTVCYDPEISIDKDPPQ